MLKKVLLFTLSFSFLMVNAQDYSDSDVTANEKSPYFKILNKDVKIDRIPLLMTAVDVNISGLSAEVLVTQYYKNDGNIKLEAQYVFPGSSEAAVHAVKMHVGERIVDAEIKVSEEAKELYTQAKKEGKTTSLLEQGDPGLFTMNLANILPGDEIKVELLYTERLIPTAGIYTFRYPAIGRPSVLSRGSQDFTSFVPGENMGFDMVVNINSPLSIEYVESLNHSVIKETQNEKRTSLFLDPEESLSFSEDFVIRYSLKGTEINSGTLLYQDDDAGYFLLMLQPPTHFTPSEILPREYIFVVDSSGSMSGKPIENAQFIANSLLSELTNNEYFNVILFAGGSKVLSQESLSVSNSTIEKARQMVEISSAGGGTDLLNALLEIDKIPKIEGVSRSLIILTDGAISVAQDTLDKIRRDTNQQNVFVIGVSLYGNDSATVKSIADAGQGQSFFINADSEIIETQKAFLDYVRFPLLTDIEIDTIGFSAIDLQPTNIPDLFAQRPLYLTGKFEGQQRGSLKISGKGNGKNFSQILDLDGLESNEQNKSVKYLWAREKINGLGNGFINRSTETESEITELGLKYSLLTPYTSFVAVDEVIRAEEELTPLNTSPVLVGSTVSRYSGMGSMESTEKILLKNLPSTNVIENIHSLNKPLDIKVATDNELSRRPSITFIMSKDKDDSNQYFQSASLIYRNHPEYKTDYVVDDLLSLEEVKMFLKKNSINHQHPWGLINVVTHSSPWSGLNLSINNGEEDADMFLLHSNINDDRFQSLEDSVIDNQSEIRVIGCALGNRDTLLSQLSIFFGGKDNIRPIVKSPKHHVLLTAHIGSDNTVESEALLFLNPWFFEKTSNLSTPAKVKTIIQSKSPIAERSNPEFWRFQEVEVSTVIPWNNRINSLSLNQLIKSQDGLTKHLSEIGADSSEFDWQQYPLKNGDMVIKGRSTLIMLKPNATHKALLTDLDFDDSQLIKTITP